MARRVEADDAVRLHWASPGDAALVVEASALFDESVTLDGAAAFLEAAGHHLCLALAGGVPIGFVSGIEMRHPDKSSQMLLYELSVAESDRRRGVGTALVHEMTARASALGCHTVWVAVDTDNGPARATYRRAAASHESHCVIVDWPVA